MNQYSIVYLGLGGFYLAVYFLSWKEDLVITIVSQLHTFNAYIHINNLNFDYRKLLVSVSL